MKVLLGETIKGCFVAYDSAADNFVVEFDNGAGDMVLGFGLAIDVEASVVQYTFACPPVKGDTTSLLEFEAENDTIQMAQVIRLIVQRHGFIAP